MQTARIDRTKEWTVDDYLQLEESLTPCQLINGELIMSPAPTPYHQLVSSNINELLRAEAKRTGGLSLYSPLDLFIDRKTVLQPDLVYISVQKKEIVTNRGIEGVPDIVVEIISPSNIFTDRNQKKKIYQQIGVPEFWIVDPGNRTLEIYLSTQRDPDTPHLYFADEGIVKSSVLLNLQFELSSIF